VSPTSNVKLSLAGHRLRCPCGAHSPLELRWHCGDLILARFCSCGTVTDVRARFLDWMAVHHLLAALLDQAQRTLP
jgi:hypothetical protein